MEYEEGMEKREDISIYGECKEHGVTIAQAKRFIGEKEPLWLCPQCMRELHDVQIIKRVMPCTVCGFCDADEIKLGFHVCDRCVRVWRLVSNIMGYSNEPPNDQQ